MNKTTVLFFLQNAIFLCAVIRNKFILTILSLLLFTSMTLADTRVFYMEQEQVVESKEVEREELKENAEGKVEIKTLLFGSADGDTNQILYHLNRVANSFFRAATNRNRTLQKSQIPLFLMYCCLMVHRSFYR